MAEGMVQGYRQKKVIFRVYQVIWYVLGVIESLLAFRFMLKLLAANPLSGFTNFIYTSTALIVLPFKNIFPATVAEGSVLEWSVIIAAIVYLIGAYGLVQLFQLIKPTSPEEVEQKLD